MLRAIAFAAVLVVAAPIATQAATSNASNKFMVPAGVEKVAKWYEANRAGVLNASNCRIIQDRGNGEYHVQTNTPVGASQYVIKETRQQDRTKDGQARTVYRIAYVRNISGRVANHEMAITMTEIGGKTEISMSMTTSVAGRFVPVAAVRRVQSNSLAGSEQFITGNAR